VKVSLVYNRLHHPAIAGLKAMESTGEAFDPEYIGYHEVPATVQV
jgi:hypothetical protein